MKLKSIFVLSPLLFIIACLNASVLAQEKTAGPKLNKQDAQTVAAVRAVLDAQVAAWNRGSLEGFMDGYARSDETVFVSGDNVTRGWQTVLDRYHKGYDTREKMGQLAFSELQITPLSKTAAVALGRWQLTRAKDSPHGRFTLIFRRTNAGWRIVHDHTS
jgi:ketosteroid isomerase-like protein